MLSIINNLKEFFNNRDIEFIIGGGYAIRLLAIMAGIECDFPFHNLDIFYMANTPITAETINDFRRIQNAPYTSVTYINNQGMRINITMLRSHHMRCAIHRDINIMHPMKLYNYYVDIINQTPIHFQKMIMLKNIDVIIPQDKIKIIYKYNPDNDNENILYEPVARRLCLA